MEKPVISIKDKLLSLLDVVLNDAQINPAFKPVIKNLAKGYIDKMNEDEIRGAILQLRDKFIPWVIGEPNEDTLTK